MLHYVLVCNSEIRRNCTFKLLNVENKNTHTYIKNLDVHIHIYVPLVSSMTKNTATLR